MTDKDGWLERYGAGRSDITWPLIYWVAVPTVVLGLVGILWTIPVPEEFVEISPLLNWGSVFLMATAVYYFIISLPVAIGMLPFMIGLAAFQLWLGASDYSPLRLSGGLLTAGIIGLWLGHRNGNWLKPLFEDLMLMMIAPAWMLSRLYRRLGIPY